VDDTRPVLPHCRETLCDLLEQQNRSFGAADPSLRTSPGCATAQCGGHGQQVTLFGGPLFTILKAATTIRKAKDASIAGSPHVPIFCWRLKTMIWRKPTT